MMHSGDIVADQAFAHDGHDTVRRLTLSQTLGFALLCALAVFLLSVVAGGSVLGAAVAAFVALNVTPVLLGLILAVAG